MIAAPELVPGRRPMDAPRTLRLALLASAALHALIFVLWHAQHADDPSPRVARLVSGWAADSVEVGVTNTSESVSSPRAQPQSEPAPGPPTQDREQPEPASEVHDREQPEPHRASVPRKAAPLPSAEPKRAHANDAAENAGSAASATAASSAAPATPGSLGALGLPSGVQYLAKAFAWALPEGGHRDAAWSELPLGAVGQARIAIYVNADGRIDHFEIDPELQTPAPIRRMLEHALFLLRPRTFSLDARSVSEGVERLSVDVTLSDRAPSDDTDANPRDLASEGHRPPEAGQAGYARFTLNSGRHLEAVLRRLPAR